MINPLPEDEKKSDGWDEMFLKAKFFVDRHLDKFPDYLKREQIADCVQKSIKNVEKLKSKEQSKPKPKSITRD